MIPGLLIVFAGLFLMVAPLVAAQGVNHLRFDHHESDRRTVVSFRAAGVALAAFGYAIAALGRY